jgi:hypothetical protein
VLPSGIGSGRKFSFSNPGAGVPCVAAAEFQAAGAGVAAQHFVAVQVAQTRHRNALNVSELKAPDRHGKRCSK